MVNKLMCQIHLNQVVVAKGVDALWVVLQWSRIRDFSIYPPWAHRTRKV